MNARKCPSSAGFSRIYSVQLRAFPPISGQRHILASAFERHILDFVPVPQLAPSRAECRQSDILRSGFTRVAGIANDDARTAHKERWK
jgi:hypothetical protein